MPVIFECDLCGVKHVDVFYDYCEGWLEPFGVVTLSYVTAKELPKKLKIKDVVLCASGCYEKYVADHNIGFDDSLPGLVKHIEVLK